MNPLKISADLESRTGISRAVQALLAVLALTSLLLALHEDGHLVNKPEDGTTELAQQPHIICSIGLKAGR